MIMITQVISQLQKIKTLRHVAGAAALAAVNEKSLPPSPTAYVVLLNEAAGNNRLTAGIEQVVTEKIGVILVVKNLRDAKGEAAAKEIETLRAAVLDQLIGWLPSGYDDPLTFSGGDLAGMEGGAVWYQLIFTAKRRFRKI